MKSLALIGRRWFQRGPGNTYHTVEIFIDGVSVHRSERHYGYGSAYEQSAVEWLEAQGLIKLERYSNGSRAVLWVHCKENGIDYSSQAIDVPRRKDL